MKGRRKELSEGRSLEKTLENAQEDGVQIVWRLRLYFISGVLKKSLLMRWAHLSLIPTSSEMKDSQNLMRTNCS